MEVGGGIDYGDFWRSGWNGDRQWTMQQQSDKRTKWGRNTASTDSIYRLNFLDWWHPKAEGLFQQGGGGKFYDDCLRLQVVIMDLLVSTLQYLSDTE